MTRFLIAAFLLVPIYGCSQPGGSETPSETATSSQSGDTKTVVISVPGMT